MKKLLLLTSIAIVSLTSGCISTSAYHQPVPTRVIFVDTTPAYYPVYTTWRIGYDWGVRPRYMSHGHWHRRR